ncbi:hypothetical protein KGA09_001557 [Enterococcus faecalis]|nr:hypothetical protein [Enterococcus faecalis]
MTIKEITLLNTRTGKRKTFYNVYDLEIPGYQVNSCIGLKNLLEKENVKFFSFKHANSNNIASFRMDIWTLETISD